MAYVYQKEMRENIFCIGCSININVCSVCSLYTIPHKNNDNKSATASTSKTAQTIVKNNNSKNSDQVLVTKNNKRLINEINPEIIVVSRT